MARIMIVDDALFMRQMLSKILTGEGHEICSEAANAKDAVEQYKKCRPELVTMDIVMPLMEELDGIGAVKEILQFDPQAKILLISAMSQQPIVVEAILLGAKDFLSKPVNPERLKETVKNILTAL